MKIWAITLALASFSCIFSHCASFSIPWRFSKKDSGASSSASFTFPSILPDLKLPELFDFELFLEDLPEWLFVLDEASEHLSSSFVYFSQECTFLLKLKIILSTSSRYSSLFLICFSSIYCLHSSCAATSNFRQGVIELCHLFFNSNLINPIVVDVFHLGGLISTSVYHLEDL